jgi:transcriptional regulator with XRE-family HTH domain
VKEIKDRLIELRQRNGLTKLGINKSSITRYESGEIKPTLDMLINISKTFNVSMDWLSGFDTLEEGKYDSIIKECVKNGISPDKLQKFIELMKDD